MGFVLKIHIKILSYNMKAGALFLFGGDIYTYI